MLSQQLRKQQLRKCFPQFGLYNEQTEESLRSHFAPCALFAAKLRLGSDQVFVGRTATVTVTGLVLSDIRCSPRKNTERHM